MRRILPAGGQRAGAEPTRHPLLRQAEYQRRKGELNFVEKVNICAICLHIVNQFKARAYYNYSSQLPQKVLLQK